ncbi:hypothetical protein GCM10009836_07980 [Pseudonocardia ailaonensis]|uniref:Uncharacterized protein n=1 Tax=Pseudonocardia ailaonensis TaxID=367279 RepID=A0ABN2MMA8_9PSEU
MTGPLLHPVLAQELVRERHAEIAREVEARRLRRLAREVPRAPSPLRTRIGWGLVEVGLRLAVGRSTPVGTGPVGQGGA